MSKCHNIRAMDMSKMLATRRNVIRLGVGGALLVPALLAGCGGEGEESEASSGSISAAVSFVGADERFAKYLGMEAKEAWDALVEAGWGPLPRTGSNGGEPGTVTAIEETDAEFDQGSWYDLDGNYREDFKGVELQGCVSVDLEGMASVPSQLLFGNSGAEAVAVLKEAGFANVETVDDGDVDSGANRASACDPQPMAWALLDDPVVVTVSSWTEVPDIVGLNTSEAAAALTRASLAPVYPTEGEFGSSSQADVVVVSTTPVAGEIVKVDSLIDVEWSDSAE